jgi:hypothetical protein
MAIDNVSILSKELSNISNTQNTITQNITADDEETQLQVPINQKIKQVGNITLSKYTYLSDSFILDHPVQGYLDTGYSGLPDVVSYLPLESDTNDKLSSISNTATDITYSTGKINNCAVFNGTSSKIVLDDGKDYTSSVFNFVAWIYVETGTSGTILSTPSHQIYVSGLSLLSRMSIGTYTLSGVSLNNNAWNLIKLSITDGADTIVYAVNNSGDKTTGVFGSYYDIDGNINIGYGSTQGYFNSKIDDIYINDTNDNTIYTDIYNSGIGITPEYIAYKLDGGYEQIGGNAFPLIFPITFSESADKKELIFSYDY